MKLFEKFEAVRFPEENLIFVTHDGYLYYIYNPKYKHWRKHGNAGNDHITVANYQDVSRQELADAMGGTFPAKETDFMRLCQPSQLCIGDMLDLLDEDYSEHMSAGKIYHVIRSFLIASDIRHKSYEALRKLLDNALSLRQDHRETLQRIKELSFAMTGRDIFKDEIRIVDGHEGSSDFSIMPVHVIDDTNTNSFDSVGGMTSCEISIEEDDVYLYLAPFLKKYFDDELNANKSRIEDWWTDDFEIEHAPCIQGFEWHRTHNFYTHDSVVNILKDIKATMNALSSGGENEYAEKLRKDCDLMIDELLSARDLREDQYEAVRLAQKDHEVELIIDFYRRFIYRMEHMMTVGKEDGYDLISFMGP